LISVKHVKLERTAGFLNFLGDESCRRMISGGCNRLSLADDDIQRGHYYQSQKNDPDHDFDH